MTNSISNSLNVSGIKNAMLIYRTSTKSTCPVLKTVEYS